MFLLSLLESSLSNLFAKDRAAPAKILLDSGADPNALVSPTYILHMSEFDENKKINDPLQLAARCET